ncbi:DUF6493 family protein [Solirubrobacter phytolaccae]|uniref:DUF6493 family protein n=1 Tax=Solirubrobacter phytolaccae TaxID=1404360 RepID=A0A9X3NKG8_9ACTN|nr:DUF6493 family protein [Solirubrobacter phytolaccae]MDA0183057.1 DUF6493 family protein [Solirubrobacter phytolaccae]
MTPDPLLAAIIAGDARAVVLLLRGWTEAQRRERAPALLALERATDDPLKLLDDAGRPHEVGWDDRERYDRAYAQRRALEVALVGTASLAEQRALAEPFPAWLDVQRAAQVVFDRDPPWLADWTAWQLRSEGPEGRWPLVHLQVRAGLIKRPRDYLDGLLGAFPWFDARDLLEDDPELLEHDVWALLCHHDGQESLRAAQDRGAHWREALIAQLDRERLIDATLEALGSDLSAHRAAFFTGLWRELAVTNAERAARHDQLRGLLGVAAANVLTLALDELTRDPRPVAPPELAPALAARAKRTARGALKLLDRAPDAATATIALGHPDADVQAQALDRLERWGLTDAARDALLRQLDLLSATQRPRAEALLGVASPRSRPDPVELDLDTIPEAIRRALNFGGAVPRAPVPGEPVLGEPIEPIASLDELADVLATTLSEPWRGDERLLDGVLRFCDRPFDGPLRPFHERILDLEHWFFSPVTVAAVWATGFVTRAPDEHGSPWELRLYEASQRVVRGEARPLLSLPTHAGGWIEPRVLLDRMHEDPDPIDLAQALLRLAPEGRDHALRRVRRHTKRGPAAEAARAAREPDRFAVEVVYDDAEPLNQRVKVLIDGPRVKHDGPLAEYVDTQRRRWSGAPVWSVWPERRDIACACALPELLQNLESGSGRDTDVGVLLEALLDQPLPPLALRLLVQALGSAYDREHIAAVDVLIAGIQDGRVDATALPPDDLARIKPNRLAARLQTVADGGPLQRAVVRDFLDAHVAAVPERPAALLVLFDELSAQTGVGPQRSRAYLETLSGTSKAAKAAKALLARAGEPPPVEAELALAARVRRAQRWMG